MAKYTQIGALVEKDRGLEAYHKLAESDGVVYAFVETGRSNDLFSEKQFGEFGEAAILTMVVEDKKKDIIISNVAKGLNLTNGAEGLVFEETQLLKCI